MNGRSSQAAPPPIQICGGFLIAALCLATTASCRRESTLPEGRQPSNPAASARYGPPRGQPATDISRLQFEQSTNWRSAPFYIIETELSPATLVHSSGRYLGLFRGLSRYGLGAPTAVAWSTKNGPRSFKNGEPIDVTHMEENWGLVWFAGASNWVHWDSPWAFFLQHRPASMKLDPEGLHLTFSNRVGDVVLFPLYGAYKPPLPAHDVLVEHGLPSHKIKTWEWAAAVPRDPLVRLRFWSRVTRRFPIHCEDSFSVDRSTDSITIRSRLRWYAIQDEWQTPPLSLAPLSPVLALAVPGEGLPVRFSSPPFDLGIFTPYGPFFGVPDTEEFDATFSVLQYINETARVTAPVTNADPVVTTALARLRTAAREFFTATNETQEISSPARLAQSIPYLDPPTRLNAEMVLRKYLARRLATIEAWQNPRQNGDDGAPRPGGTEDLVVSLWAYAHFSDDWAFIRNHWSAIRKIFALPGQTRWATFGRADTPQIGRDAASCAAFARLAYQAADMDSYHYACAIFVRALMHDWTKLRGPDYFRKHQPIHSMEFMAEPVFLTHVRGDGFGWQIDGPAYPVAAPARYYTERWKNFSDGDLGRFFQDYLGPAIRLEIGNLTRRSDSTSRSSAAVALGPGISLARLRSLLMDDTSAQVAAVLGVHTPGSLEESLADAISVLRKSDPVQFERLIPSGPALPFVAGPERDVSLPGDAVVTDLKSGNSPERALQWPRLGWQSWKTTTGDFWTVGHIQPVRSGAPRRMAQTGLNWNTRVTIFEVP